MIFALDSQLTKKLREGRNNSLSYLPTLTFLMIFILFCSSKFPSDGISLSVQITTFVYFLPCRSAGGKFSHYSFILKWLFGDQHFSRTKIQISGREF